MVYRLPEIINKTAIYDKILPNINRKYRELKENEQVGISLVQTVQIYSNALPLLMSTFGILRKVSGRSVYLELSYNPRLLSYLDNIGFFHILSEYGIIEYDEEYIGDLWDYKYNNHNQILKYESIKDDEDTDDNLLRDEISEKIRSDLLDTSFFLRNNKLKGDQLRYVCLTTVTELIVNAIIYSGSLSYAYVQSGMKFSETKKGYLISVCDAGHGFYYSLGEKIKNDKNTSSKYKRYTQKQRTDFYQYAENLGIDVDEELNFLSIMEALYFSKTQTRDMNLYQLKELLVLSNANLRIHQGNREIVFTSETCRKCTDRDILNCVKCIWEKRKRHYTPLKCYNVSLAGVHIEVEIIKENRNV